MAASQPLKPPNPALLDVPGMEDLGGGGGGAPFGGISGEVDGGGGDADAGGGLRFGPLVVGTRDLDVGFRVRQRFDINDRVKAYVGLRYSKTHDRLRPIGSLTCQLDERTRAEVTDERASIRRKYVWTRPGGLSVGVSAECRVVHAGLAPGASARPEFHLSLDRVRPIKYELLLIGAVLAAGVPFSLRDKMAKLAPWPPAARLLAFGRASLRRTAFGRFGLDLADLSGVLDV